MKIQKTLIATAVALGLSTCAYADLLYTYDTGLGTYSLGGATWDSGLQAMRIQHPATGGFAWYTGALGQGADNANWQAVNDIISSGYGQFSFDVIIDDTSFAAYNVGLVNPWYKIGFQFAWNGSAATAANGVTVNGSPLPEDAYGTYIYQGNANDWQWAGPVTYHVVCPPTAVSLWNAGWADMEFSVNFSPDLDSAMAFSVAIDNVKLEMVPEPSTFALMGLGTAALLIFRRRQ